MEVQGEMYFLFMMHMHFLCFLTARRVLHLPVKPGRLAAACAFSSLYSLLSLLPGSLLQNSLLTALSLLLSARMAFGSNAFAACLPMGMAGLCYGGLCGFLAERGAGLTFSLAACTLLCLLIHPGKTAARAILEIRWRGKTCRLAAYHDTGNTLQHALLCLPVILAPERQLRPLLPEGFSAAHLSTLQTGFVPVPVATVNGRNMLMGFHPDQVILLPEGRNVDALIAITPEKLPHALLPCTIKPKEERPSWKKHTRPGNLFPPSADG